MTTIGQNLIDVVKNKGWMAISGINFDGGSGCMVYNSGGNVAISEETESVYWITPLDSEDSAKLDHTQIVNDSTFTGMYNVLTQNNLEQLFWVDYSMFLFPTDLDNKCKRDEAYPVPKLLKKEDFDKFVLDESTGLYTGAKYVVGSETWGTNEKVAGSEESIVPLFLDTDPDLVRFKASARISYWKDFFNNQERFKAYLTSYLGIGGLI